MINYIMANKNGREIPKEDRIFALNGRAKAKIKKEGRENVINATIGALLDDNGELVVLDSVTKGISELKPKDFSEYAPIAGIPEFKEAIKKAAFLDYKTDRYVEVVTTPGGTGGIRNAISNYSKPGDKVLTSDWYWAPYKTICQEIGRSLDTYNLFDNSGKFNIENFGAKVRELALSQERLVIILNTPAHNPTGYSLDKEDWEKVIDVLNCKELKDTKIALFLDVAYVDFAGDEKEARLYLPMVEKLNINILPIIGYSASKTFTIYGMRCGAMLSMAKTQEIADEFKSVCEFSSRGSWSNCSRGAQQLIANIYADPKMLANVDNERIAFRKMLMNRGIAFEKALKEVGIKGVPFDAGFFACIACDNPDEVSTKLEELNLYAVPLAKGIRISVASISEEQCIKAAKIIAQVLK